MTQNYHSERGNVIAKEMFGPHGDELSEDSYRRFASQVDEDYARIICDFGMNGMYSRPGLSTEIRELCFVAALTVMGEEKALESHIRIALNSHPSEVVREVILQMGVMAGMPLSLKGLRLFERIVSPDAAPLGVFSDEGEKKH
jgi:alkylhydroperoxidase/carboxymuconolactone decarboxylase family protein YurZ